MAGEPAATGSAERNGGHTSEEAAKALRGLGAAPARIRDAAADLAGAIGRRIADSVPSADLDDRDPDYIRENLPLAWLLSTLWFRGEVRNLGNIPESGPVLLVGNHSGGIVTPDTLVFTLAFNTYFGVERRLHPLAHNLLFLTPQGQVARRFGAVPASQENARAALQAGAAVLVYPGGDMETHRPSWQRHRVDFAGRRGFVRLALEAGVPIVPVVAAGGQETALFLSQGAGLARATGLDRIARADVLPISLALPWGLNVGDVLGHLPLPAKITIEVLPSIDVREEFGPEPVEQEVYEHVTGTMQDSLNGLAAERRWPVIG